MRTKDLIRLAVIKTNPYWPFSYLNKLPYRLAIKVFVQQCKKFPEIKSFYLKHSFTEGSWVPGVSDIDWTIVIDSDLSIEQELVFLNTFWNNYNMIKKFFPMLGEGEISSTDDLENMSIVGVKIYESLYWKLMYGKGFLWSKHNLDSLKKDKLFWAFHSYYFHFTKSFFSRNITSSVLLKILNRISQKIIRYLDYDTCIEGQKFTTIFENFTYLMKKLDRMISGDSESSTQKLSDFVILGKKNEIKLELGDSYLKKIPLFIRKLRNKEIIDDIFFINEHDAVVCILVKDNLVDSALNKFLIEVRNIVLALNLPSPFIVTKKILKGSIEAYDPFWYYSIRNGMLYGKNITDEIEPPRKFALIYNAIRKSIYSSAIMRRQPIGSLSYTSWLFNPIIDHFLGEIIILKLFLEKGIIISSDGILFDNWKRFYNDSYSVFIEINKKININKVTLAKRKFSLIRNLIESLNQITSLYINDLVLNNFIHKSRSIRDNQFLTGFK